MGRGREHAVSPPKTPPCCMGQHSPRYLGADRAPSPPSSGVAATNAAWPPASAAPRRIASPCTFPEEKHRSRSRCGMRARNPVPVPAGGEPGADLLSSAAGRAGLQAGCSAQASCHRDLASPRSCATPDTSVPTNSSLIALGLYWSRQQGTLTCSFQPAMKIPACHAVGFGPVSPGRGLPAWPLAHPEDARAPDPVGLQHAKPPAPFLFPIHKEVGAELVAVLTWKVRLFKIQPRTPAVDLISERYGKRRHAGSDTGRLHPPYSGAGARPALLQRSLRSQQCLLQGC